MSMTFTKQTDEAIINRMAENFLKMKKLRSRYGTLFFMSIVILTVQCIFFIVGGFNIYMAEGIVMNFLVFYFGTKKFDSVTAQYILMAVNIVAAAAFIIWNPVSEVLLRLGIVQHFYLALVHRETIPEVQCLQRYPSCPSAANISKRDCGHIPNKRERGRRAPPLS